MPTISLCMIVRDEAAVLERCLQSVAHLVDEIIIVDTGSVDETKTIAAAFTPHLYDFPWQDDFLLPETLHSLRARETIYSGWMQMMYCLRKVNSNF